MAYELRVRQSALNYLKKLDVPAHRRLVAAIEGLMENPPAGHIRPLQSQTGVYRLRVGGFRVLLEFRTPTTQGFFTGGDAANPC